MIENHTQDRGKRGQLCGIRGCPLTHLPSAWIEWNISFHLAARESPDGKLLLYKEDLLGIMDGTLFPKCAWVGGDRCPGWVKGHVWLFPACLTCHWAMPGVQNTHSTSQYLLTLPQNQQGGGGGDVGAPWSLIPGPSPSLGLTRGLLAASQPERGRMLAL